MNENKSVINVLKQNIDSKLNYQDSLIEIKNIYGVFLENNTFLICEEYFDSLSEYPIVTLYNFFSGKAVSTKKIDKFATVHFRDSEPFYTNDNLEAVAIPIKLFLYNHVKKGMVTEKNVITVYNVVNDYIKNNPTFIDEMFEERKSNKHI